MKKIKFIFFILIFLLITFFGGFGMIRDFIYPLKYNEYVDKYSEEFGVDRFLVYAVIKGESNFDPEAVSSKGAVGLMQVMQGTADEIGASLGVEDVDLYDEEVNIRIGTKYLSDLIDRYDGNINLAIIAYNAGTGNVSKWIEEGVIKSDGSDLENVPYKETNMYVRKILRNYRVYGVIYKN